MELLMEEDSDLAGIPIAQEDGDDLAGLPDGWRQICGQGHRSGQARKCKQNEHEMMYMSPDGQTKFPDLESVHQHLYGAEGDIWAEENTSLEEMAEHTVTQQMMVDKFLKLKQDKDSNRTPNQNQNRNSRRNMMGQPPTRSLGNNILIKTEFGQDKQNNIFSSTSRINNQSNPRVIVTNQQRVNPTSQQQHRVSASTLLGQRANNSNISVTKLGRNTETPLKRKQSPVEVFRNMRSGPVKSLPKSTLLTSSVSMTISPPSPQKISLPSGLKISAVKGNPNTNSFPTYTNSKSTVSISKQPPPKIELPNNLPSRLTIKLSNSIDDEKKAEKIREKEVKDRDALRKWQTGLISKANEEPKKKEITRTIIVGSGNASNNLINLKKNETPRKIPMTPRPKIPVSTPPPEKIDYMTTPLKCYCCQLGSARLDRKEPGALLHIRLSSGGLLDRDIGMTNREVMGLASYLKVPNKVAASVLRHFGVSRETRDFKSRMTFVRKMCWDNMNSLEELCDSFEHLMSMVDRMGGNNEIMQEVLGQADRWRILYSKDSYHSLYMTTVFFHIHQDTSGTFTFTRGQVVTL